MKKIDPKCKLNQKGKRINVPVSYECDAYCYTAHTGLVPLKAGAWEIYGCNGENYGYIVGADIEKLLKLLAERNGYRLVKEPKEVK